MLKRARRWEIPEPETLREKLMASFGMVVNRAKFIRVEDALVIFREYELEKYQVEKL